MRYELFSFLRKISPFLLPVFIYAGIGELGGIAQTLGLTTLVVFYLKPFLQGLGEKEEEDEDEDEVEVDEPVASIMHMASFHEAGHAVVAWALPGACKAEHVTIVQKNSSNGCMTPKESRHSVDFEGGIDELAVCFAGMAAQQEFGCKYDAGGGGDLKRATFMARFMVCEWGFSDTLPRRFYDLESSLMTEEILAKLNTEIERFLKLGEERAQKTVKAHSKTIAHVASILQHKKELDEEGLREAIETAQAA